MVVADEVAAAEGAGESLIYTALEARRHCFTSSG